MDKEKTIVQEATGFYEGTILAGIFPGFEPKLVVCNVGLAGKSGTLAKLPCQGVFESCPVFACYTLSFALELRENGGKRTQCSRNEPAGHVSLFGHGHLLACSHKSVQPDSPWDVLGGLRQHSVSIGFC